MLTVIATLRSAHDAVFITLERTFGGPGLGLLARLVFASVLLTYFWQAAFTKVIPNVWTGTALERVADGPLDYLGVESGAYAQIAPEAYAAAREAAKAANDGSSAFDHLSVIYDLIVYAGTYAEFVLPLFIVLGLFTRLSALGMIAFLVVQTYVDVTGHNAPLLLSAAFDAKPDDILVDQRLLWLFPLVVLTLRGGGWLSLDSLLRGVFGQARAEEPARAAA